MANTKKEETQETVDFTENDFNVNLIDDTTGISDIPMQEVPKENNQIKRPSVERRIITGDNSNLVNCLKNERITVRFIARKSGIWGNDPKHVLAGGMSQNAVRVFTVPRLLSGVFKNVLTNAEKDYLENIMGLEPNALSVHKRENNFWSNSTEGAVNSVALKKEDNYFDLSIPEEYIKYKILLANNDVIAPSLNALQDSPKATYQFVIIREDEEVNEASKSMSVTMRCYKEYGKIEEDIDKLRLIIELIDGKPTAANSKLAFLQTKINELIQSNSKLFLSIVTDPLLDTKVLIRKCTEAGIIAKRGNWLYLRDSMQPLCNNGEEPTLNIAAKYLNDPVRQELKFSLEAKLKR